MRRSLVFMCVTILVVHQTIAIQSGYGQTKVGRQERLAAEVKSKVEELGLGALVAVDLDKDVKARGQISEILDTTFKLSSEGSSRAFSYKSARGVGLVKPNYKTNGAADPVLVRQCVVNLGVGQNASVRVRGERLNGRIEAIDREGFTLRSSGTPQKVKFDDVTEIKRKSFPAWGVGAIAAGVAVGVAMGAMLAACGTGGC